MDDTTFLATWDDTGDVGSVNMTIDKLKVFTTNVGSNIGEHITSILKNTFSLVSGVLSEVGREILLETDDLVFKLRLKFDICCMASEERRVQQIEENPNLLDHMCMYRISL